MSEVFNQMRYRMANNKWTQEETQKIIEETNKEADRIIYEANREKSNITAEIERQTRLLTNVKRELDEAKEELRILKSEILLEAINISEYEGISSNECKDKLQLIKIEQKELISSDRALNILKQPGNKKEFADDKKQILRCFEAESSNIIENVSAKNVDTARKKLTKSFEALNKIFLTDGLAITPKFFQLKLEELSVVYAYSLRLEEEREQRRFIKEQLLEEEKVRREIEKEKSKLEKEETQFKNEINKLMTYMNSSSDSVQIQLYVDKIKELEQKLKEVEISKENVLNREQNTRAGFVYIISNIGSFGENVYKIGLTRRLEPLDRISELASASVPFAFDVHAMIFSDDAPALENILHQTFKDFQINRINNRKEFFKIDLEKIKEVIYSNHNATVNFTEVPEALEYRESLRVIGNQPPTNNLPAAAPETIIITQSSTLEATQSELEIFQFVQQILELENLSRDLLYTVKQDGFFVHLNSMDSWILAYNSANNFLRLPFSIEVVAKRIGSILQYEADGDNTKIFIKEPQDTYKLAKLIARRVKEIQQ